MNLKELSNEELLDWLTDCQLTPLTPLGIEGRTELLSRLELGKHAIEIVDELYTWNLENFPHLKVMVIEFIKERVRCLLRQMGK
jgi:hypothetical protein